MNTTPMNTPSRIVLHEELMREGMQIESVDIPVDDKVELLDALSRSGLEWINVGSFVSPRYTPQMEHIDEVLKNFTPVDGVNYTALALNRRGWERAAAYPFIQQPPFPPLLVAHLCDTFVRRNANMSQADEIGRWEAIADHAARAGAPAGGIGANAIWGSNFEGKFDLDEGLSLLERAHAIWDERSIPVTFLMLGDPMSWNTPARVAETLTAALERWPDITTVYLHLHDARGLALASIYAALGAVGDRELHLDTTVGGIGGCPYCGNGRATGMAATEDVAHLLTTMGIDTGIDLGKLIDIAARLETIIGRPVPGHLGHAGPLPGPDELYDENLPLVETHAEALHFKDGAQAVSDPHRPWHEAIPNHRSPEARRAEMIGDTE